jgi:hypothetical protein
VECNPRSIVSNDSSRAAHPMDFGHRTQNLCSTTFVRKVDDGHNFERSDFEASEALFPVTGVSAAASRDGQFPQFSTDPALFPDGPIFHRSLRVPIQRILVGKIGMMDSRGHRANNLRKAAWNFKT